MLEADYFARKRAELGLDREVVLGQIQVLLDTWYPQKVRARRLHQGVLHLSTPSAAVAGAIRMRQVELLDAVAAHGAARPARLAISIEALES